MHDFIQALRVEWIKLRYYRTFWILLAIIVVCVPAFNYIIYDFTDNNIPKINGQSLLGKPFSFPDVWRTVPFNTGMLLFMPAILIITIFSNEYAFRTHRQNVIDGWSRSRFIQIKLAEVFLLTGFVTGITILTCLYFEYLTHSIGDNSAGWPEYRFILYFFVEMLDYMLIAAMIAMLVRRAGLSMGIFFLYMFVEQFVVAVGRNKYKKDWVDYLPEEVSDRLIPNSFARRLTSANNISLWEKHVPLYLAITLLYIFLYVLFIYRRFHKTDL
jgi:ABC-2 type transport system permease protein